MPQREFEFRDIRFRGKTQRYFVHEIGRPRFSEVDHYGVVWNGHFVNYFETARLALCARFGFNMELLAKLGIYLPVYSYEVTVRKPVLPLDTITVGVRPVQLAETQMDFDHVLLVDGEVRATAKVRHVAMSKDTGSIVYVLPEDVLQVFSPLREEFSR